MQQKMDDLQTATAVHARSRYADRQLLQAFIALKLNQHEPNGGYPTKRLSVSHGGGSCDVMEIGTPTFIQYP